MHISITTTSKYIKLEESQIPKEHISKRGQEHIDAINKVKYKVDRVLLLHNQGVQIREISKITGYSESSVKKYISEQHNIVHGQYGVSRHGILEPYRDEVLNLRCKGIAYKEIVKTISEKGYKGSVAALRGFIAKERRIAKDLLKERDPVELIDKKSILKLLYKPIDEVKELTEIQYNAVVKEYPIIATFINILTEFKGILVKKDSSFLKYWIEKVHKLKVKEMDSFINGLENDYNATLNAIELTYNNGLAEGSVNKIKNIKRIMYGRNSFTLLRHKVLQLEALKNNH